MEAVAQLEQWRGRVPVPPDPCAALEPLLGGVRSFADDAADGVHRLDLDESALFAAQVEELSRTVEYLQIVAAGQLDRLRTQTSKPAAGHPEWTTGWRDTPALHDGGTTAAAHTASREAGRAAFAGEFRNSTEYLRVLLRIGAGEARRRLALAAQILPRHGIAGQELRPQHEHLAAAVAAGTVSSRAATVITLTLEKTRHTTTQEIQAALEQDLTATATRHDPDFLTRIARRWTEALDPDGHEPTQEELRHTQGAFLRKPKHGLNHLEIFATQDQYEHLLTVMNPATNPRSTPASCTGACTADTDLDHDKLDRRSRPQKLLDGLISACKAALTTGKLPTAGGHRPQIMATINYRHLLNDIHEDRRSQTPASQTTGTYTFTGPIPAATLRQLACDADIIPIVLGGEGQVLDIGRAGRLFPPHLRKAITARDQGCAFPGCTIPAPWCETHHIRYWSHGGPTSTDNGTLLCSHHHHVIHKELWTIQVRTGVPWFIPPRHVDPQQQPVRNHYFRC